MIRDHTTEEWADIVTLGSLTIMFWVMFALELWRTWRWDALGRALTVLTGCLAISYSIATLGLALDATLWIPPLRWAIRIALFGSGVVTIVVLLFDRPPMAGNAIERTIVAAERTADATERLADKAEDRSA